MFEILILSFIQGVTEFLPVSSSSHLILFSEFAKFENKSLGIDVSLHIGSFIAVLTYFYKDIFNFFENRKLFIKIIISSIPVILIGYVLVRTNFIEEIRNIKVIAWMTIVFGILLYISDKFKLKKEVNGKNLFVRLFELSNNYQNGDLDSINKIKTIVEEHSEIL